MNKIYDVCMFLNENDLYEIRLNEHYDFVEKFIVIESLQTHAGNIKKSNFDIQRFDKFKNKIIYVLLEDLDSLCFKFPHLLGDNKITKYSSEHNKIWARENIQTNFCIEVLNELSVKDDDQILWGGLDEIVSNTVMASLDKPLPDLVYSFQLALYVYKLNIFVNNQFGPLLTSFRNYKKTLPSDLRSRCVGFQNPVLNAGWHFTGLTKDATTLRYKYQNFSHSSDEFWNGSDKLTDLDFAKTVLRSYIPDFFENQDRYVQDIDKTFPKFIYENLDTYKDYIYTL